MCFVRFELSGDDISATVVGVGHRFPAECAVSVSQALELAEHYPVVVRRTALRSAESAA